MASSFYVTVVLSVFIFQAQAHQLFKFGDDAKSFDPNDVSTNYYELCLYPQVSILYHQTDCSRFWKCKGSKAYLQVCNNGKKFDTKTLMCTHPKMAACLDSQT